MLETNLNVETTQPLILILSLKKKGYMLNSILQWNTLDCNMIPLYMNSYFIIFLFYHIYLGS